MLPHEYRNADEVVRHLSRKKAKIETWFAAREKSLELLVKRSVGGNTFRAFQNMPVRPSVVFREWASGQLEDENTTGKLFRLRSQVAYDRWHEEFCSSFRQEWEERMGEVLPYGPSRKLPDLLLKAFVRWSKLTDDQRSRLTRFLHVSLDSLSLVGIRRCIDDPEIPVNATMSFVVGPTMYRQIQEVIRAITKEAEVPAVYYDVLVWDIRR